MNFEDANILVVDDEPDLCKIFAGWLKRAGCLHVRSAMDGKQALAAIEAEPVHLLITDVRMPYVDGLTLVRRLRGIVQYPPPTILFISGFGDVDQREMYALGVEAFLSKPLGREEFVERAKRALMDKADLLHTPMSAPPLQSLIMEHATLVPEDDEGSTSTAGVIRMGRCGFAVSYPGLLTLGKVAFCCRFTAEQFEMAGHGYVRWYAKAEQAYGIELAFLAEPGRSKLLESSKFNYSRSFIPASLVPALHAASCTSVQPSLS